MLEWIITVAALGLLASRLMPEHFDQARQDWGLKPRGSALAETPAPPSLPGFALPHAERARLDFHGSVKAFGLDPQRVQDLRIIRAHAQECLPRSVAEMLEELHRAGRALGSDIMEFVHFGRPLKRDQAIYFALLHGSGERPPEVFAFVDRLR